MKCDEYPHGIYTEGLHCTNRSLLYCQIVVVMFYIMNQFGLVHNIVTLCYCLQFDVFLLNEDLQYNSMYVSQCILDR